MFSLLYPEQIPTFTFTAITAGFAYQAYKYTKEKFRLDLYEKRMVLYEALHLELSTYGHTSLGDPQSTSGVRYHKFKLLYGDEIAELIKSADKDLVDIKNYHGDIEEQQRVRAASNRTEERARDLSKIFAPYLYFGDYKSNMENENNLCELCVLCGEKFKNLLSFKSQKGLNKCQYL